MKILNHKLKNNALLVGNDFIEFDEEGIAMVSEEVGQALKDLPGYTLLAEEVDVEEKDVEDEEVEEVEDVEETEDVVEDVKEVDYSKMTNNELKDILDEKGIEYKKSANKDELLELLK